jgi:beta-glucuronidase
MTQRLLCSLALALCAIQAPAATRVDLNREWLMTPADAAAKAPPAGAETRGQPVDVPYTWNRGRADCCWYSMLGAMWFVKQFDLPKLPADAIAQLHFGGTFYKSRVFVNGVEVGGHEGGYHEYSFDIAKQLREKNTLAVLIDNRPGMYTIPGFGARGAPDAWYDWWAYGGITRDVWLDLQGPVRIANQFIRARLDAAGPIPTLASGSLNNRLRLVINGQRPLRLIATIGEVAGVDRLKQELPVQLDANGEMTVTFKFKDLYRWTLELPMQYEMRVRVVDADGHVLASDKQKFGLRSIEIRDRHLLLNGERVRLTGMTRHADSPWEGGAETRGTWLHDWEDMKSLNMHLTRPVHYAPDPAVVDFADQNGILLIPEIPVWQASEDQLSNPQYLALARQQMRELIEQYGNHPSVFAWSVMNESAAGSPAGIRFFREMRDFIRSIDPDRPVTLADDNLPKLNRAEESAANDADFLMMNQYFGAWHGPREALDPALDKVDRLFPDKMVIISEMGYPGIFAKNPADADPTRVSILREQLPLLARRDWIAGAILWCYQDYKSRRYYWPGQEQGYLEHGIVDENRQRKPSYFAWKDLNEPAQLQVAWTRSTAGKPTRFKLTLTPNTPAQLPYLSLASYQLSWQLLGGRENREFAAGGRNIFSPEPLTLDEAVTKAPTDGDLRLRARLTRPDGSIAVERVFTP